MRARIVAVSKSVQPFGTVDVAGYPDVHALDDDLDVALWVLLVGSEKLDLPSMSAAEVADAATLEMKRALSRQRAAIVLAGAKGLVARVARSKPARFTILHAGAERVRGRQGGVLMIDPTTAFSGLQQLDAILGGVEGELSICDPYVDDKTLVALTAVPKAVPIKLLTLNISDPPQLRRKLQAYEREYGNLEMRTSLTPDLHDRYMIDAKRMWLLGQSLNGIGKKQTFIVAIGEDVRAATDRAFRQRWSGAPRWT